MRARTVLMCCALLLAPAAVAEEGYGPLVANGLDEQLAIGADLFFSETFDGNGRTCATCHLATENYTLPADLSGFDETSLLMIGDPDHPNDVVDLELCHRASNPGVNNCEAIEENGLILVNADGALEGIDDFSPSYVMRSVPHTLSLSLTLEPLQAVPVTHLTGWAGDGSPDPGSLNTFAEGAVRQHFTKSVDRNPPDDFRLPTQAELDAMEAFQRALGRTEQVNLASISFLEANANNGKALFGGSARRCQICHAGGAGGGLVMPPDRNVLLDNGVEERRIDELCANPQGPGVCADQSADIVDGANFDGGFGTDPHPDNDGRWGLGKFDPPPLIEAVDTPPFFHDNGRLTLEDAINHYRDAILDPVSCPPIGQTNIICGLQGNPGEAAERELGSMLRILNAGLNLSMATQRLHSAFDLLATEPSTDPTIIKTLELAYEEIEDAWTVLDENLVFDGDTVFEDTGLHISEARSELDDALDDLEGLILNGPTGLQLAVLMADLVAVSENHLSDDFYDQANCGSTSAYDDCDWIFEPGEANKLFDNAGVTPSIVAGQTQATWSYNPDGSAKVKLVWKTAEWSNPLFDRAELTQIGTGTTFTTHDVTVTPLANGQYKRTASITIPCVGGANYRMEGFSRVGGTTESDDDTAKAGRYCIAF